MNETAPAAEASKSEIATIRPKAALGDTGSHRDSRNNWIAQTTPSTSQNDNLLVGLTAAEYRTLQYAYDYFNVALFGGLLPQVLITLQRHPRALGYFSAGRFQSRGLVRQHVHEIALNPDGFTGNKDEDILSTLVHEMVHVWQKEYGKPSRRGYHNREWSLKMCDIGLMPSSTGRPGGARTGESMSDYILEDGQFLAACEAFLSKYRLAWESAGVRANHAAGDGTRVDGDSREGSGGTDASGIRAKQTRTKFTCPNPTCGLNVWAKPDALIDCHKCSIELGETISMCANYTHRKQSPRKGEERLSL